MDRRRRWHAFTLIELLTVIAIIGILGGILMPVISSSVADARKLRASRALQQIAMVYAKLAIRNFAQELNACETATDWAGVLSKYDEINSPSTFIFADDYLASTMKRPIPKTIGFNKYGKWAINPEFENFPLSIVVITGISFRAPGSTTPIAYSRGLDEKTGCWRTDSGPNGGIYGTSGGFIVFLDGHVEFFPNLTDEQNKLINYYTGEKTSKISESVNVGARAISWQGVEWDAARRN